MYSRLIPRDQVRVSGNQLALSLGELMRQNPLPPGRYWIDVFGDNRDKLATWFASNRDTTDAISTESFDATADFPARDFYIFRVSAPTGWDGIRFGFPSLAPSSVKSSADTAQRPDPEPDGVDTLQSGLDSVGKIAFWGVLIVGGVLALRVTDALSFLTRKS